MTTVLCEERETRVDAQETWRSADDVARADGLEGLMLMAQGKNLILSWRAQRACRRTHSVYPALP
jgi:hypothetical protein